MFKTGVVSVTFRQKSIDEVITMAAGSGLDAIEVGSDVHAPRGDLALCRRIGQLAESAGIAVASYGSYYRLAQGEDFQEYVAAAKALGAKNIRVWAGVKGSAATDEAEWVALIDDAKRCAELVCRENMTLSFEYHGGTVTDTSESALRLMRAIDHPSASLYWQPNQYRDVDFNLEALRAVLPYVSNIHVFAWTSEEKKVIRHSLADHEAQWRQYLDILLSDGRSRYLLLEFVKGDDENQFFEDAKTLKVWVKPYARCSHN